MQITLLDMLDLISVGTPVSWGDVQRTAGEAASAIRKLMDERPRPVDRTKATPLRPDVGQHEIRV